MTNTYENAPSYAQKAYRKREVGLKSTELYQESFRRMQTEELHPGLVGKPLELLVYRGMKRRIENSSPISSFLEIKPNPSWEDLHQAELSMGPLLDESNLLTKVKRESLIYTFEPHYGQYKDTMDASTASISPTTLHLASVHLDAAFKVLSNKDVVVPVFESTPESIEVRKKHDGLGYFEPAHVIELPLNGNEPQRFLQRHHKLMDFLLESLLTRIETRGSSDETPYRLQAISDALAKTEEFLD